MKKSIVTLTLITGLCMFQTQAQTTIAQPTGLQQAGTVRSGKFQLHYRIEGTGPAALVIGSSIYYPRIFSQNLRNHLQLIFMDVKAWVPAAQPVDKSEFELDVILDDIELMRKTIGVDQVIVIGHSGHAIMALEYAKKYPQHVSHVVMIASGPDFSAASIEAAAQYWQDSLWPERKEALENNLQRITDKELEQLSPGPRWIKNYVRVGPKIWYDFTFDSSPLWQGIDINMQVFDYIWKGVFKEIDTTRGLESFDKPVFLALGRYDFIVAPPCSWDAIRDKFKNLTLRVFERSGHTPQYEEPALFDEELLKWISQQQL